MLLPKEKKSRRSRRERQVKRGIYVLPNLFTTANLFCGFYGIVAAINHDFKLAAIAILVSCLFDILDGKVARYTGSNSRFGLEYDSLADLVAFGVTPAVLVYLWALQPFGRLGWGAAFVFVACGALRLARFNVQANKVSKKYFVGLPIPGAACMVATTVLLFYRLGGSGPTKHFLLLAMTYLLGFLMVSSIPFNSFKELDSFQQMPFRTLVLVILLLSVVAAQPAIMLFTLMSLYLISGPASYVRRLFKARRQSPATRQTENNEVTPAKRPQQ
ncbi:MAG: CDP-diacylglycerol--serine O-phosphatidyltransferase [Deltaproteobacteria bacterium]|nr:CDP-diacylglycerol--serine O-phosphatidyltransferase [Deltaproteobacteria bacterium]MBW2071461.1 CDP-diacylglycerol--serine O-phosphatidyltransferase [Deltaproteobacteria bacterium]